MSVFALPKYDINGRDAEAEATRLHFRKNQPDRPDIEFPPYNPHAKFPCALYRRSSDGDIESRLVGVADFEYHADERRWVINESLHARNANEHAALRDAGWAESPADVDRAKMLYERRVLAIPAAERAYDDRHMSDAAQAEVAAIEDAASDHVVDVDKARAETKETRERAKKG